MDVIRHAQPMFSKIIKCQYLQNVLSNFVYLLHLIIHQWELQRYHAVLVRYGLACQELSENNKSQTPLKRVELFC